MIRMENRCREKEIILRPERRGAVNSVCNYIYYEAIQPEPGSTDLNALLRKRWSIVPAVACRLKDEAPLRMNILVPQGMWMFVISLFFLFFSSLLPQASAARDGQHPT